MSLRIPRSAFLYAGARYRLGYNWFDKKRGFLIWS
jgi:hypothetical protein